MRVTAVLRAYVHVCLYPMCIITSYSLLVGAPPPVVFRVVGNPTGSLLVRFLFLSSSRIESTVNVTHVNSSQSNTLIRFTDDVHSFVSHRALFFIFCSIRSFHLFFFVRMCVLSQIKKSDTSSDRRPLRNSFLSQNNPLMQFG